MIFGRAAEEIAALREANIPFEIVPGITTAFAAAARLKTPLTDRGAASKLILATAHHAAGKLEVTPKWTGAFPEDATLVIYMPGRKFRKLADDLIGSGIDRRDTLRRCQQCDDATGRDLCKAHWRRLRTTGVGLRPSLFLIGYAIKISEVSRAAVKMVSFV